MRLNAILGTSIESGIAYIQQHVDCLVWQQNKTRNKCISLLFMMWWINQIGCCVEKSKNYGKFKLNWIISYTSNHSTVVYCFVCFRYISWDYISLSIFVVQSNNHTAKQNTRREKYHKKVDEEKKASKQTNKANV